MAGTFTSLYFHIVFSTHNREPLLIGEWHDRMHQYLTGIARQFDYAMIQVGGMPDHVHLVVRLKANVAVAEFVRVIKANSSKWINEQSEFQGRFAWQRGYSAFTVSKSQLAAVITYVQNQAEHHRFRSFREEYLDFLVRHEIPFDERYIWD